MKPNKDDHRNIAAAVRRGMLIASGDFDKQELAQAIDCPRTTFGSFLKKKKELTSEQILRGRDWLIAHQYWEEPSTLKAKDPALSLSLRLRAFADDMDSSLIDHGEKVQRLIALIAELTQRLDADIAAFEKWQKRRN